MPSIDSSRILSAKDEDEEEAAVPTSNIIRRSLEGEESAGAWTQLGPLLLVLLEWWLRLSLRRAPPDLGSG